jgi:Fe2+ transport system protein B
MKKIEDYQLQMYVDNELSQSEMKKVQDFIDTNSEAKSKVDNYKKINNLVIENFRSLETEEIQKKTIDLLLKEDISIINKILNYRIKLVPAFASFAVVLLITIFSYNSFIIDISKETKNLNARSKSLIIHELKSIIGEQEITSLVSTLQNKDIKFKLINEFKNNSGNNCKEFRFFDFRIKDLNIDEAIFCNDGFGNEKLIKINFFKGKLKQT